MAINEIPFNHVKNAAIYFSMVLVSSFYFQGCGSTGGGIGGIGGGGGIIVAGPTVAVLTISNNPQYDFGSVQVGAAPNVLLTITHSGDLDASGITEVGLAAPFSFTGGGGFPGTGGSCPDPITSSTGVCTMSITYTPTADGFLSDQIILSFNDGTGPTNTSRTVQGTGFAVYKNFIYTGNDTHIGVSELDLTNGILKPLQWESISFRNQSVAITPNYKFLYSVNTVSNGEWGSLEGFSTDFNGAITPVPSSPITFSQWYTLWDVKVHPNGLYVYASNSSADEIRVYSINQTTGELTSIQNYTATDSQCCYALGMHPSGNYLYATGGSSVPGDISNFLIDSGTGLITGEHANSPWSLAGWRYTDEAGLMQFNAAGTRLWTGLGDANDFIWGIMGFDIDGTGGLTLIAGAPFGTAITQAVIGLQYHESLNKMYATTLSSSNNIRIYNVAGNGALTEDGAISPKSGGGYAPTGLLMDLTKSFLMNGHNLFETRMYDLNSVTGELTNVAGSPFWGNDNNMNSFVEGKILQPFITQYAFTSNNGAGDSDTLTLNDITGAITGVLETLATDTASTDVNVHPTKNFVYVHNVDGSGSGIDNISGFTVDPATGLRTQMAGSPFSQYTWGSPGGGFIHPTGKYIYQVDSRTFAGGDITGYSINQTTGVLSNLAGSPWQQGVDGLAYLGIGIHPTGRWLYFGRQWQDEYHYYDIDPTTGGISPVSGSPINIPGLLNDGVGTFHPNGKFLYISEASSPNFGILSIDEADGSLGVVNLGYPPSWTGTPGPSVIHPTKYWLYLTNNGGGCNIRVYDISSSGNLSLIAGTDTYTIGGCGAGSKLKINFDGEVLYYIQSNGSISQFDINQTTGELLEQVSSPFATGSGIRGFNLLRATP